MEAQLQEAGLMSDQQQYPQQQEQLQEPQQHVPNGDAAREQQLVEAAFGNGLPRGPDGLIDFEAAVHLLLQAGADLPTLRIVFGLFDARQQEQQQQQARAAGAKMVDFGESLRGRPRQSRVLGFSPRGR